MSKITGFTEGFTTSGMMKWYAAILDCGHWHYSGTWQPFPSEIAVGSEVECGRCADLLEAEAELEALDPATIHHMRFSTRFAYPEQGISGQYHAYKRDPTSPTGVIHMASFPATKRIDAIINRKRICALSPTEGR